MCIRDRNGTVYTKAELEALSAVCRELALPLFLDGARLGYALAAQQELTLADIARLCDVFYIGGTKVGALFGEAVVITAPVSYTHLFVLLVYTYTLNCHLSDVISFH